MAHPDFPSFIRSKKVEETQDNGEWIHNGLRNVFRRVGFDPGLITHHGAMCMDVQYGPDVAAVKQFNPRLLIASEPDNYNTDEEIAGIGLNKEWYIEYFGGGPGFQLIREYPSGAITQFRADHPGEQLALFTWLHAYPTDLTPEAVTQILAQAAPAIIPKGLILVSIRSEHEDEFQYFVKFMMRRLSSLYSAQVLTADAHDPPEESICGAGVTILVAQRKEEEKST